MSTALTLIGMQYVRRSEHFSVTEIRRSRATRPYRSMSSSFAGRPTANGAALDRGIPRAPAGMLACIRFDRHRALRPVEV